MTVGYVIDTLISLYKDCLFQFLIPYIVSVLIVRVHSMFTMTDVEPEYHNKSNTNSTTKNKDNKNNKDNKSNESVKEKNN